METVVAVDACVMKPPAATALIPLKSAVASAAVDAIGTDSTTVLTAVIERIGFLGIGTEHDDIRSVRCGGAGARFLRPPISMNIPLVPYIRRC
jgi:hypothetical protein